MKKIILTLSCIFLVSVMFAQSTAGSKVDEGIKLHDSGDFKGAIAKYDEVLAAEPDNIRALSEKALSLLSLGDFDQSIALCEETLKKHPGNTGLKIVYVTYGNALDAKKQPKKSINIYDRGIKDFPDFYQLYYNKGITLSGMEKYDDASESFQQAVQLNPKHASSHNAIGRIAHMNKERVPAILAFGRFLIVEPRGERAKQNAGKLLSLAGAGVKQTGENNVTITLSSATVDQASGKGKKKENDFSGADLLLSMSSALDYDEKNKGKTQVELFAGKMETLFSSLDELKGNNSGFFWEYYVPYFIQMKEKKFLTIFSNIVFAAAGDEKSATWVNGHEDEVKEMLVWSDSYAWQR